MVIKEKLVGLLAAGTEFEYKCENCGELFEDRPDACPICGNEEFAEIQAA